MAERSGVGSIGGVLAVVSAYRPKADADADAGGAEIAQNQAARFRFRAVYPKNAHAFASTGTHRYVSGVRLMIAA